MRKADGSHNAIYKRNILRTAGLFMVFAVLCSIFYIPCYIYIRDLNQNTLLEHYENSLKSDMAVLDASLEAILSAETTLTDTGTSLTGFLNQDEVDDLKLLSARKFLSNYFMPYGIISNIGMTIGGEPAFDRYMLFYNLDSLSYQNHLSVEDTSYWSSMSGKLCVIPSTTFHSTILHEYQAVTVAYRISKQNNSYLFVHYSTDALMNLFASDDVQKECRISIYYQDQLLAENRGELETSYKTLSATSSSMVPLTVTLQFTDSFLAGGLAPFTRLVALFTFIAVCAFIVLILLFTFVSSKPINNLTQALIGTGHVNTNVANMSTNDFLLSAVQQMNMKIEDCNKMIDSQRQVTRIQLLERAMLRGLYSEDDRRFFDITFPDFPAYWQLALVQYLPLGSDIEPDAILTALSQYFAQLSDHVFCLPFSQDAVIVLFPVTQDYDSAAELKKLCSQYEEEYPVSISYQLGQVYHDPALLPEAYQQIEYGFFALRSDNSSIARNQGAISMSQLQTMYYALQTGDDKTAIKILESSTAPFLESCDRLTAKYAYRALNYMLLQMKLENRNLSDILVPSFSVEHFVRLFREDFPACFETICKRMIQDRADQAQSLEKDILDFIEANLGNQQLSVTYVTEQFHISAPTLQKRMNACVGKTFSSYVEELRMSKARKALLTTELPVQDIANSVGYTNTNSFYKAYRRMFGESPRSTKQGNDKN